MEELIFVKPQVGLRLYLLPSGGQPSPQQQSGQYYSAPVIGVILGISRGNASNSVNLQTAHKQEPHLSKANSQLWDLLSYMCASNLVDNAQLTDYLGSSSQRLV